MTNFYADIGSNVGKSNGNNKIFNLKEFHFGGLLKNCNKIVDGMMYVSIPRNKTLMLDFYRVVYTATKAINITEIDEHALINSIFNVASQLKNSDEHAQKALSEDFRLLTETALKVSKTIGTDKQELSDSISNIARHITNPVGNVPLAIMKMDLDGRNLEIYQEESRHL